MAWIKCTDTDGDPVHVNIDLALFVRRDGRKTIIEFPGTHLKVREMPDDLFEVAGDASAAAADSADD